MSDPNRVGVQATRNPRAQDVFLHSFGVESTTTKQVLLGVLGWVVIALALLALVSRQYWLLALPVAYAVAYVWMTIRRPSTPPSR